MTINCKGQLIDLNVARVMGILNLTPDSFYDGGKYKTDADILSQTEKMLNEGASFIDLGAYSSRPGAQDVPESTELKRMLPIVELLLKEFPGILLSIDTFRSSVAETSLQLGAALINDISGGHRDENMMPVVGKYRTPFIMMHMRGTPQTMQQQTEYTHPVGDIRYFFSERLEHARQHKIMDCILDPGFGFAKTLEQNYELLDHLNAFNVFERPVLVGLSRKSMIYKTLQTNAQNALNGTTALHMVALLKGAHILRVHDVKPAMECIALAQQLNPYENKS